MSTPKRHELADLALHGVITGAVLTAHGIGKEQRRTLIRREHLFRAHRGVYLTTDQPTPQGVWLAAVLHCGEGALLGWDCAAACWQVKGMTVGRPQVLVPAHRVTRPPKAIRVIRSRTLSEEDYDELDHIPVTSLFRTLDDLARRVDAPTLKSALRAAEYRHALDLAELLDYARSPRLRRMLETYVPGQGRSDTAAEARFLELCARSTLPSPDRQRRTAGGRVDFLWPVMGLIVEVDGCDAHGGRIAFREDRMRDRRNFRDGQITLRFTWADLIRIPAEVIADLDAAHARLCRLGVT